MRRGESGTTQLRHHQQVARTGPWAVLAVVLALMALVASVSAARPSERPDAGRAPAPAARSATFRPGTGGPSHAGPAHAAPNAVAGAGTSPTTSPETAPLSAQPLAVAGTPAAVDSASADASPPTQVASLTTAAPSSSPPQAAGTPTETATRTRSDPGNLEYPDNISASYPVPAGAGVTASATWSGVPELTLSIDCPTGHVSRTGSSGLSVSVPSGGGQGTCDVVIAETASASGTVSYSLDIGPFDG
ncbi:MAG: hypothetical protein M0Z95_22540 [Actinomycetota bacterium]|nr:hypothetical protein [Actinomycetota bacterium]